MDYLWLKSLHVACVLLHVGGIFVTSLTLAGLETPRAEARIAALRRLRVWDRWVTSPSMILLWGFGLVMASLTGGFREGWLEVKLVIVAALSGLHGALAGNLRKSAADPARAVPAYLKAAPVVIAISVAAVAFLAVTKPG